MCSNPVKAVINVSTIPDDTTFVARGVTTSTHSHQL
jgi:hypothetical protein